MSRSAISSTWPPWFAAKLDNRCWSFLDISPVCPSCQCQDQIKSKWTAAMANPGPPLTRPELLLDEVCPLPKGLDRFSSRV
jgi:hypothetical protein